MNNKYYSVFRLHELYYFGISFFLVNMTIILRSIFPKPTFVCLMNFKAWCPFFNKYDLCSCRSTTTENNVQSFFSPNDVHIKNTLTSKNYEYKKTGFGEVSFNYDIIS